jgi:hypothetical protein
MTSICVARAEVFDWISCTIDGLPIRFVGAAERQAADSIITLRLDISVVLTLLWCL